MRRCWFQFLLVLPLALSTCMTRSGVSMTCIPSERQALLGFKQGLHTNGNISSWGSEEENKDCCGWSGVSCDSKTNNIINLTLNSLGLEGNISPSLALLNFLRVLDLGDNILGGEIPVQLWNLSRLEYLNLGQNQLEGTVPDAFGNMISLQHLDMSRNHLQGAVPKSLGNISSLLVLDLSFNNLSGELPEFLGSPSLQILDLGDNQLSGPLPESIGRLSALEVFHLSWNSLEGTISDAHMSNLSRLSVVYLCYNKLTINFSSNWVPPFQLNELGVSHCMLGPSFPNWIRKQNSCYVLDISGAGIRDSIPNWFWKELSPQLQYLNMSDNKIWGSIPNLPQTLDVIDMSSNNFEGQLPVFPAQFKHLSLSNNHLSGPLTTLCQTINAALLFLDLSNNLLSGEILDCESSFPNLKILNLANNSFSGKFPDLIGSSCQLASLHLESNNFSGDLPEFLQNCSELKVMDLRMNGFSGMIPKWIGQELANLVVLSLQANELHGRIPKHLCRLVNLHILDLSLNNISGSIPSCLGNLTAMTSTGESSSMVTNGYTFYVWSLGSYAPIYPWFSNLWSDYTSVTWKQGNFQYKNTLGLVKSIDLSSNNLIGEIPKEITNLIGLISLNLSRNNLTGQIPSQIGHMGQLESLDLSRNQLYGPIPASLTSLNFLSCLDLANNNLSGRIPRGAQLETINASAYEGNKELCGPPITEYCPGDIGAKNPSNSQEGEEGKENERFDLGFYICTVLGFIFGFWGVFGTLLVKSSWTNACAMFLISMKDNAT